LSLSEKFGVDSSIDATSSTCCSLLWWKEVKLDVWLLELQINFHGVIHVLEIRLALGQESTSLWMAERHEVLLEAVLADLGLFSNFTEFDHLLVIEKAEDSCLLHVDDNDVAFLGVKRLELYGTIAIEPPEGLSLILATIPSIEFVLTCF